MRGAKRCALVAWHAAPGRMETFGGGRAPLLLLLAVLLLGLYVMAMLMLVGAGVAVLDLEPIEGTAEEEPLSDELSESQQLMEEMDALSVGEPAYYDIRDPWLHAPG